MTQAIQSVDYISDHKSKKKIRILFRSDHQDAPTWQTEDLQLVFEDFEMLRKTLELLASYRSTQTPTALFRYENVGLADVSTLICLQNCRLGRTRPVAVIKEPRCHKPKPAN